MPINRIKETEAYCPTYENGTQLALIRYPHAGTFEIPVVTVNNKNVSGKRNLGQIQDAIGINAKVAERLSGADFDAHQQRADDPAANGRWASGGLWHQRCNSNMERVLPEQGRH